MTAPAAAKLGGLSECEWELAHKLRDAITIGGPEPDVSGFDPERVRTIRNVLLAAWYAKRDRMRRRRK